MPLDQLPPTGTQAAATRRKLFRSTKSYGHAEGLSCVFRQWRAGHPHCRLLHGYALTFRFMFVVEELDERNWCFDFGGLKPVKAWLHEMFDHTLVVAADDPELETFKQLAERGIVALRVLPVVGCEAIAGIVFGHGAQFVADATGGRVRLEHVEVSEHSGNAASYSEDDPGRRWRLAGPAPRLRPARPAHDGPGAPENRRRLRTRRGGVGPCPFRQGRHPSCARGEGDPDRHRDDREHERGQCGHL